MSVLKLIINDIFSSLIEEDDDNIDVCYVIEDIFPEDRTTKDILDSFNKAG